MQRHKEVSTSTVSQEHVTLLINKLECKTYVYGMGSMDVYTVHHVAMSSSHGGVNCIPGSNRQQRNDSTNEHMDSDLRLIHHELLQSRGVKTEFDCNLSFGVPELEHGEQWCL
jgi:hypothetical protein